MRFATCLRSFALACLALASALPAGATPAYAGHYDEPYRPAFHFTPPTAWMNDPNGLVYLDGTYHLFYQYYPDDTVWGPMHWGHATSTDLVHWRQLPIALYPDEHGWIFSGSAVIDKGNTAGFGANAMVAIFTYHNDAIWKAGRKNTESQGIAYSLDHGATWTKYAGNPVLDNSGEQDFRDPKVFWNETIGAWNMVLAVGDRIRIFSSPNLVQWRHESDFKPDPDLQGLGVWECPDLFPLPGADGRQRWVLIVNHGDKAPNGGSGTRYFVGDFDGKTFVNSQGSRWLDAGTDFYAAVTYGNVPDGKRILLAWMSNWQYATKVPTAPWRSAMTLPRELQLVRDGESYRLRQSLPATFEALKKPILRQSSPRSHWRRGGLDLSRADIQFATDGATDVGIELANGKGEVFRIRLQDGRLTTDRSRSGQTGFSPAFAGSVQAMPLDGARIDKFRLVLDRASVEILLNDDAFSMTNLFFPTEPYSILRIDAGRRGRVRELKVDSVAPAWP